MSRTENVTHVDMLACNVSHETQSSPVDANVENVASRKYCCHPFRKFSKVSSNGFRIHPSIHIIASAIVQDDEWPSRKHNLGPEGTRRIRAKTDASLGNLRLECFLMLVSELKKTIEAEICVQAPRP